MNANTVNKLKPAFKAIAVQPNTAKGNKMELALWGLPKGETDRYHEQLLTGGPKCNRERVEQVKKLAAADGWHSFRVQIIDGKAPDFGQCVSK